MKAVNLIPADQRSTARNVGKSGGAVYGLLGVLGIAVVGLASFSLSSHQASERQAQAVALEAQAQAAQTQAGALASYKEFAALATSRGKSVRDLAQTREDWGRTLEQMSQIIPADVSLSSVGMTTSTATQGAGVALRSAMANPAVEMLGCAPSQARVALLMARLRRIDGVVRVSVSTSDKSATAAATTQTSDAQSSASDCTGGSDQHPEFQMVAFLNQGTVPTTATAATATATQSAVAVAKDTTLGTTTTTTTATPAAPATTPTTTTTAPAASGS
jgi:Tfp pilus assembly protein PilN